MLTTQEKAHSMICPVRSLQGSSFGGGVTASATVVDMMCAGSRCMAWRWDDDVYGYCGLAGIPQDAGSQSAGEAELGKMIGVRIVK